MIIKDYFKFNKNINKSFLLLYGENFSLIDEIKNNFLAQIKKKITVKN